MVYLSKRTGPDCEGGAAAVSYHGSGPSEGPAHHHVDGEGPAHHHVDREGIMGLEVL